jgi:hypothetical protein
MAETGYRQIVRRLLGASLMCVLFAAQAGSVEHEITGSRNHDHACTSCRVAEDLSAGVALFHVAPLALITASPLPNGPAPTMTSESQSHVHRGRGPPGSA